PGDKNIPQVYYRIGECYEKQEKFRDAVASYLRLNNINNKNPWYFKGLLKAASLSLELDEYTQAESILNLIIHSNPEGEFISQTWLLYSDLYYAQDKYKKSVDVLESLLQKSISVKEKCLVVMQLADIYHDMGFIEKSIYQYQQIINQYNFSLYKQRAFFNLGLINKLKGNDKLALDNFQQTIQTSEDTALMINAYLNSGEIYLQKGNFNQSLFSFNSAIKIDSVNHEAQFGKACSLTGLKKQQSAALIFSTLLEDSLLTTSLRKKILLHSAALSVQNDAVSEAITYMDTYISEYPEDPLIDFILLKKGKFCLQNELWDEGYFSLRKIWKNYPRSNCIPEARFTYAAGLERVKRIKEAHSLYKYISDNYPLSEWAKKSYERIQFINKIFNNDYDKGLVKLSEIITGSQNAEDNQLQLGKIYFYDFKNYKKSISFLKPIINDENLNRTADKVYFLLGEAYKNLYLKYDQQVYIDSARYYHLKNINKNSPSVYAKKSCLSLAKLRSKQSIHESYTLIKKYSLEQIDDSLDYEFIYHRADLLFELDSLSKALQYYSIITDDSLHTKYHENSLYMTGKIQYLLNSPHTAHSTFSVYKSTYKNGKYLPAVLFYQAQINENLQNYQLSINNYNVILDSYFYSFYKDSAEKYLGNIYLKTGKYNKAVRHYNRIIRQDSVLKVAISAGLVEKNSNSDNKINYLFNLAKSYQLSQNLARAQKIYLKYGKSVTSTKKKIKYYTALSTIAEQRSDTLRAIEYLRHLFKLEPSDTIAIALGDLYLKSARYDEAREVLNQGITHSNSESIKCHLSAKIIISLLKEKKIPQADVRIKIFDQSYKNVDDQEKYLNEFHLEKGKAYIDEKDFNAALKFLKKVEDWDQYKQLIPEAKFQIGRIYLITNKVEKALDILTYLTENYQDHPISFKVYLNLGYHYYRSQQYQNAIHALKTASSSPDMNVRKTSLRILIKIYEENGLTDNALKVTREYINEYPNADDILQQKIKLGTLLMQLHEYDRAIEHLRSLKVYSDAESEARIQYWIAKSYYNMGRFRQSIFEFLKVKYFSQPTKLPWKTTAMYEASNAYIKLKEYDHARDLLEKIIQIEGTTSSMGRFAVEKLQEIKSGN
ncbi:MAG: tetratricopeptide repeat protein, partial [bacterium]